MPFLIWYSRHNEMFGGYSCEKTILVRDERQVCEGVTEIEGQRSSIGERADVDDLW